ncbi:MAG: leucine-rich repeat domain-containing protein [Spirochaetia bacterium]|nr:leucine-rich repeat domain-containing protein [Spirochaetia bacterium]
MCGNGCRKPIPVTGVTLDQTELTLPAGKTAVLKATVEPADATVQTLTWSAEPADAVMLIDNKDGSCTVSAVKEGTATVTVTTADGSHTAQCTVTVYASNTIANLAFIQRVEKATDSRNNPVNIGWTKEDDGTVKLTSENLDKIRAVTELNIEGILSSVDKKLTDLSGIEYFTGLTYLNCGSHELSSLDVSKNTKLETLNCNDNQLTTLNVSNLTALRNLHCSINKLTSLNISNLTALWYLDCSTNELTELNVSGCTALETLNCNDNQLTTLNVSNLTALTDLDCRTNELTELNVSGCTALESLSCNDNELTELNVSGCTKLGVLRCNTNQLPSLDVSKNTEMTMLYCASNRLKILDISANTYLWMLDCDNQKPDGTTVSDLTLSLTKFQKQDKWDVEWKSQHEHVIPKIPEVPVTGVSLDRTELELAVHDSRTLTATVEPADASDETVTWSAEPEGVVTLSDNGDGSRTVTAVKEGTVTVSVTAAGGKTAQCTVTVVDSYPVITNLNFIKLVELATQSSIGWAKETDGTVKVTSENRKKIQAVTELNISGDTYPAYRGTDLSDIKYFTGLTTLDCSRHSLTELDVSDCTALTTLSCSYNQLKELDVSANTALTTLECSGNQLTSLDVSKNTALETLWCYENQLTTLDVSANTALTTLECYGNQMTSLDVSKNTALGTLWCYENQLTTLDVSANTALIVLYCNSNQLAELDVTANTALDFLSCGMQTSDDGAAQTLTLTLTSDQKTKWDSEWSKGNQNVDVTVK